MLETYPIELDDAAQWYSWCLHLISPTKEKSPDRHRELKLALPSNPIESEQWKAGNEGQEEEMKRSNTMSVHRSRDKHTQVKSSSKKFLAQSSRSHLVGFSHEYFTKTRVEGHSLGRSPGPVRQPVPLPRPPDDFLPPICQHRHTRDPLKEEKEHPNSVLSRVSCDPKSHPWLRSLVPYHRYCVHTCMCGFVGCLAVGSLWVNAAGKCAISPVDDAVSQRSITPPNRLHPRLLRGYTEGPTSFLLVFSLLSPSAEREERQEKEEKKKKKYISRRRRDVTRRGALTLESRSVGETSGGSQYKRVQRDPRV